jgi:hypothetical protein
MKAKTTIRYVRFRAAEQGGRTFDFWVSESAGLDREISVEISATFFEGQNRIHLQEGVGISYAKIKHFLESAESSTTPLVLRLSAADLALHRQVVPVIAKRWHGPATVR